MNILLLGYGKMGKAIEQVALGRGHCISHKISRDNAALLATVSPRTVDVVIEFTQPEAAFANIGKCLQAGLPVVSGTTGWLEHKAEMERICRQHEGAFLHASNFSIGVNLFFKISQLTAKLMQRQPQYDVGIVETHHTEKKDAPSGTAIVLAEGILVEYPDRQQWTLADDLHGQPNNVLPIKALRESGVPGTHTISYTSAQDTISLTHEAHTREGFALGAVLAAEWLVGRKGIFSMDDVLGF